MIEILGKRRAIEEFWAEETRDKLFHARAIVSTCPAHPMRSEAITSKAVPRRSPACPLVFYL
jgi:hypothetical protein